MSIIKITFFFLLVFPTFISAQSVEATFTIKNLSVYDRNEVVSIPWKFILEKCPNIDAANFSVIQNKGATEIIYQLEYKGGSEIQNLLIQPTIKANSDFNFSLQKRRSKAFISKTYARFVPERKDDFAWENDLIAFRVYGAALEGTKEDAKGIDVWTKSTQRLILNERYKRGEYHVDLGDGLDYYHVGHTLGAGNLAPFIKDSIRYSGNYTKWKILDNGPLRSTFQLEFDEWKVPGDKVKLIRIISLDAGLQMNKVTSYYSFYNQAELLVAAGIIKRESKGSMFLNEKDGIMAYWEPKDKLNGTIGVGCVFTNPIKNMLVNNEQLFTISAISNNQVFTYYTGAAWDKAGKIKSAEEWINYLNRFKQNLLNPLIISK